MNKPLILTDILHATGLESTASGPNLLYPRDYLTRDIGHLVEPAAKKDAIFHNENSAVSVSVPAGMAFYDTGWCNGGV